MKKEEEAGKALRIFGLACLIIVFDQFSKFLVARYLGKSVPIISNIFHLTYIHNTGAGFGILKGKNTLLIFVALMIIGAVLFYYDKLKNKAIVHYSVGLILGGAIGNLIDRIRLGYVIDFLDFRIWPAFNVADSAVSIGAILMIIYLWRTESFKA